MTAALTGGVVTNAVNIAAVRPEEMEALSPFVPLCEKLGRLAEGLGQGPVDRVAVEFRGKIAQYDTRLLGIAVLVGILSGHTEEPVNLVNAPQMAEERGVDLVETKESGSEDFTELVTVRLRLRRATKSRSPAPASARATSPTWSRSGARASTCPSPSTSPSSATPTGPGMIGRVGTMFGEEGVNIVSAAVGAEEGGERAVMALTTDAAVNEARRSPRSSSSTASPSAARSICSPRPVK